MAIDSRTISSPVGIPVPAAGTRRQQPDQSYSNGIYGSSPPIRLPSFSSSSGDSPPMPVPQRNGPLPQSSLARAFNAAAAAESVSIPLSKRSKRRNQSMAMLMADEVVSSPVVDEGILPVLSYSFFSTLSLDNFDPSDNDNEDEDEDERSSTENSSLGSPRMPPARSSGDLGYARISRTGRKLLRSDRLPMEQILEFESLIFEHLSTKTPRHRLLHGADHFFLVTVQNPFHRSLLHSVCQYYALHSQTFRSGEEGDCRVKTVIRATSQTAAFPEERLSSYLSAKFGHRLPSFP